MNSFIERIHENHDQLAELMQQASVAIMSFYQADPNISDLEIETKDDNSPVTAADKAAHHILTSGLGALFDDIPIISEEGDMTHGARDVMSERCILVDPLDGTKEFIKKDSGEFTVCVGFIEQGHPVYGYISVPTREQLYYGGKWAEGSESFALEAEQQPRALHVATASTGIVMGSVSHKDDGTAEYISTNYPGAQVVARGSMLKFIAVANGEADAYPRVEHSMKLWDVAAGHAVVEGAGGSLTRPDGSAIDYRESSLFVGDFVASSTTLST